MESAFLRFLLKHWLPLAAVILLAMGGMYAYHKGAEAVRERAKVAALQAQVDAGKAALQRAQASVKVVTKYVDHVQVVQGVTRTIIKEVPTYVPIGSPDLGGGWRVLHDAAALGVLPDPARIADAAPVAAQAAAETVASNYGTCHETEAQLTALQGWIREQQGIKP